MSEGLTGNLGQWSLPDVLNMLELSQQSGRLTLSYRLHRADLYLTGGALVHAVSGPVVGEPVVASVLGWAEGSFRFEPRVPAPETTISRPFAEVRAGVERQTAERAAVRAVVPSPEGIVRLVPAAPRDPVTLTPSEWQVIALADGRTSVDAIANLAGVDEWTVSQLLARLGGAGLIFVDAVTPRPIEARSAGAGFFRELTTAAARALGPLAAVVVDDAVEALGATRETLPPELASRAVEMVAAEIRDDRERVVFQRAMLQWLRARQAA